MLNITGEYMKESDILVDNAANISLRGSVLMITTEKYMRESNTLVGNAAKIFLRGGIWLRIKEKYMKELKMLLDTKGLFIKANEIEESWERAAPSLQGI